MRLRRAPLGDCIDAFGRASLVIDHLVEHRASDDRASDDIVRFDPEVYDALTQRPGLIAFRLGPPAAR